ncbi:MAG: SDR family NAD(P)-dependent oxidoreductase [Leucobacter sp.]
MVGIDPHRFRGRTALVTGGSDGIGWEIARALAAGGARVLLPVRSREKGERAAERIREQVPEARLHLLDLDLTSLESVVSLTGALRDAGEPIEFLVLNAGAVLLGEGARQVTPDGFERTFQTNFLGHFALTLGILPLLEAGRARIAVQCSTAASRARIDWGDLQGVRRYGPFRAYRASKLALGLFGVELARRSAAAGWGLTVQLCHPGIAPGSGIAPAIRSLLPEEIVHWATRRLGNPPELAASTALAALSAGPTPLPRMYAPSGPFGIAGPPRERDPFPSMLRPGDARMLWAVASGLTGCADPLPQR